MAEKKGAGGKPQEFDNKTGRYGGQASAGGQAELGKSNEERAKKISAIRKYSDDPARDIGEYGGLEESRNANIAREAKKRVQSAEGFADKTRINTRHHLRHAREMGYKNQREYERAGCDFFNSDRGKLYYGIKRKRFYRYDEKTHEYAVSSDGVLHTYMPMSKKEFKKKIEQEQLYE